MLDTIQIIAAATAHEGADSGLSALAGQFGINGKIIFAQAINFIVVAYLLWRFAFKPVMASLDERHQKIAEGLQFAEESKVQLAETEKRQAEVLRDANTQAQALLHEARDNSKAFEEKMKTETSKQIEEMRQRAKEANELERQKILGEVRQEIARLVVLTSGKVLQRELPEEEKKRLNSAAVEEISRTN
jgi:F-type H+-transporting ATPase subunit b